MPQTGKLRNTLEPGTDATTAVLIRLWRSPADVRYGLRSMRRNLP